MIKREVTYAKLDKLEVDINNPRFAELYSGSSSQDDIINYLLYNESAEDLAASISEADEFYTDRALWVLAQKDGTYLVRDGNRRCAAVKALGDPEKYGLKLNKTVFDEVPVIIYDNAEELNRRIVQEHTSSLFRKWDRIAKALEVYRMHSSGSSADSMKDIDSSPGDLIKLSSFYYEAVKIGGDDLRRLLRRGRGESGGKTIVFERLFKYKDKCGYTFRNKPSYLINVTDQKRFSQYISALVAYLRANPDVNTKFVDDQSSKLFAGLEKYGFVLNPQSSTKAPTSSTPSTPPTINKPGATPALPPTPKKRMSVKSKPQYERKQVPKAIVQLIDECYALDDTNFANAKMAITRVTFECVLKYIVENSEFNGQKLSQSSHFGRVFPQQNGRATTNFTLLKTKFADLVQEIGKRNLFIHFDLDALHQAIHNYNYGAMPTNASTYAANLIPLIEFMLQEEGDLISSLDTTKL